MVKLFGKEELAHYVSPEISVGFCHFGPVLTIAGVLSAKKHVIFINGMGLSVSVPFQSLKKEFEWFAFQPGSLTNASLGVNIRTASKFIVSPGNAHKYNILFVDNQCYAGMKNAVSDILRAWEDARKISREKDKRKIFEDFKAIAAPRQTIAMLKQNCYWKTGKYILRIAVATKHEVAFEEKKFELQEDHVALLKNNAETILAALCSQPSAVFNTIKIPLENSK